MNIDKIIEELLNTNITLVQNYAEGYKMKIELIKIAVEYEKLKRDEYYQAMQTMKKLTEE